MIKNIANVKAEQPDSFPGSSVSIDSFTCCPRNMADNRGNSYKEIFPIIIDDRSVGSIRLFLMIDYEISADSQYYCCIQYMYYVNIERSSHS